MVGVWMALGLNVENPISVSGDIHPAAAYAKAGWTVPPKGSHGRKNVCPIFELWLEII